jgi:Zn finger protein HypA/HybF involved in hydrogenase expression
MTNLTKALAVVALFLLGAGGVVRAAAEADNPHGPLKDKCATCHGPEGWKPAKIARSFDHGRFRFSLEGAHVQTACRACHLNLVFSEVSSDCVSCHQDRHRGEFGDDCTLCHTPISFIDRARMGRAHQRTRFPLTGAHAAADCEACHHLRANRTYVNTPTECFACHVQDYLAHHGAGFPTNCVDCHYPVSFQGGRP